MPRGFQVAVRKRKRTKRAYFERSPLRSVAPAVGRLRHDEVHRPGAAAGGRCRTGDEEVPAAGREESMPRRAREPLPVQLPGFGSGILSPRSSLEKSYNISKAFLGSKRGF